jgi:hypothetical protein
VERVVLDPPITGVGSIAACMGRTHTVRSPKWISQVDDPERWAEDNQWFLSAVARRFLAEGMWPALDAVQRDFAASEPELAIKANQTTFDLPSAIGARHGDSVSLTVRGLSFCPEAERALRQFVEAMRIAVETYSASQSGPANLSGHVVQQRLGLDAHACRVVSTLLFAEPWFFGNGSGDVDQDWNRAVRAEVLMLRDVTDLPGYLDAVGRLRFGEPEVPAPSQQRQLARRPQSWLSRRDPSIRDYIVIAIVTGIAVGIALWLVL